MMIRKKLIKKALFRHIGNNIFYNGKIAGGDNTEKYQKWAYIAICATIFAVFAYLFLKYALGIILPFAFAFLVVALARPLINKICNNGKISKSVAGVVVIAVLLFFIVYLLFVCASYALGQIKDISAKIIESFSQEDNYLLGFFDFIENIEERVPFLKNHIFNDGESIYSIVVDMIKNGAGKISGEITSFVSRFISSLPTFIITVIVIILSLFYFSKDYDKIGDAVMNFLPEKIAAKIPVIKRDIVSVISKYIKSYLILLFLTFTELFAGFLILGVENSFVLALVIAFVDMLPVLGVGCVLVPWAVILLIGGNIRLGIGLIVLYLIIYLLRQFEEPRIISSQMNVHPLITLFAMYAGLKIAGLGGMIFAPLIAFIIKTVYSSIKKEKSVEKGKEL